MELLLNLGWSFVPPDQMLVRHYFLEQLNKPEYIWGIRAVCVMTAVLFFFLYQRLKGNMEEMEAVEAAVSGEMMTVDDSSESIDDVPVIEIAFTSGSTATPEPESVPEKAPVLETVSVPEAEPVPEAVPVLEAVPVPEAEPVPENLPIMEAGPISEAEPELEDISAAETESEPEIASALEPVPENDPVMEHNIPKRETGIKPKSAKRLSAAHKVPVLDAESNIWLWALVGVSVSIGGLVVLSIYRKKRRVA